MLRRVLPIAGLGFALLTAGCGGAAQQADVEAGFANLERQMRSLREAYEAQSRRIEAVQDRLALVEDQLESRALHGGTVPQGLPVVRLAPRPQTTPAPNAPLTAPARPAPVVRPGEPPAATITQADVEALDGGSARSQPRRKRRRGPVAPPANAARAGNIGVASLSPQPKFDTAAPPPVPDRAGPIGEFKAAEALYRSGDLPGAVRAFEAFVSAHADHGYADNALYLAGRCRYARAEYAAALKTFRRVLQTYPAGNQVPDALLMIGLTQTKLGRVAEGRETLARLQAMYPDTAAARQAAAELDRSAGQM